MSVHSCQNKFQIKVQTKIEDSIRDFSPQQNLGKQSQQEDSFVEGKWSDEENKKFVIFITVNKNIFKSKEKRKAQKIFKNLAAFIETRNSRQCRSHFQKLMKKFNTIVKMKKFYRSLVGEKPFDSYMEQVRNQIQFVVSENKSKQTKEFKKAVDVQVQTQPFPDFFKNFENFGQIPFYFPNQQLYWGFPSYQ